MSTGYPPIKGGGEPWVWPDGSIVRIDPNYVPPKQHLPMEYARRDATSLRMIVVIALLVVEATILFFLL